MSRSRDGFYIGLDLGTSGLKGVALSAAGVTAASASAAYPTRRPTPGAAEQDPRDWLAAVQDVTSQLRGVVPATLWRGIGLSAMIPTLVTVGADGQPTGPAITWQDGRAAAWGDTLRERCGSGTAYRVTGQWLDGRYLLPMFLRLAGDDQARAAATAGISGAKDYVFGWLTGESATDPSTASGYGCYDLGRDGWSQDIAAAAAALYGRPMPALPPVLPARTCRPLTRAAASRLGCGQIPVCLGAADSVLGALGLGVREPGDVAYIAGTSNVIIGVVGRPLLDPGHRFLVTPMAEPGRWGLEMDVLATGSAIRWLAEVLSGSPDENAVLELAASVGPEEAPLVLPYLSPGEQGALWDGLLHGTIAGLSLRHDRRHLARGLVNGILLESRRCLTVLDEAGEFSRDLHAGGAGAADPSFRSDLANVSNRRVFMPAASGGSGSALGAALLAARALDRQELPSPPSDSGLMVSPDQARTAMWDRLWTDYEAARQAITPYYRRNRGSRVRRR